MLDSLGHSQQVWTCFCLAACFFGYMHGVSEPPAKITNQVHGEDMHQIKMHAEEKPVSDHGQESGSFPCGT